MSMKMLLTKPNSVPPNGFRWVDPVDGWTAHAWSYDAWVDLVKHHLQANNRSIPESIEDDMQTQLCMMLPAGWCNYDDPNRPRVSTDFSWGDLISGLKTFASWIASGCQYVLQEEADRRAQICGRCYLNVHVEGCGSCHKLAADVTKNRHTKYDFALKACAACHCLLKAKVHFEISTLDKAPTDQALLPNFCWLKKDGQNYRG